MGTWLDSSRDPLHVMRFPAQYAYEELDRELTAMREYFVARERQDRQLWITLLVDLSAVETSEARNRKRIADTMTRLVPIMQRCCAGQAYVVSRPIIRAALTATMWLRSPPWPVRVFASRADADPWLAECLEARRG
ncbi:MAG: hypothetical protein R3B82_28170 [Sandaracinaceae bacterium]